MLYTASGPLLRLKDGNQELSDNLFMDAVEPLFATRLAQYNSANGGQGGTSGGKPATGQTAPDPSDPAPGQEKVVYTAVRVTEGTELSAVIAALNTRGVKGLFFFSPEDLPGYDKALRRLVGSGHRVGLIPQGQTLKEQLGSMEEGNRLLSHILRQETLFALASGQSKEMEAGLRDAGYLLWKASVREEGQGTAALMKQIKNQNGRARVLLQATYGTGSLAALLGEMQEEPFDLRQPRETSY